MIGRSVGLIGVCFCISGCGLVLDLDPGDDAGPHMADAGAAMDGGVSCGAGVCPIGMICCNASCGVCTVPGGGCIDIACLDGGPALPDAAVVDAAVVDAALPDAALPDAAVVDAAVVDAAVVDAAVVDAAVVDAGVCGSAICRPTETCCSNCDGGSLCVSAPDECPTCPPACSSDDECAPTAFCERTAGGCDGSGTCTARPSACSDDCPRVCGCDGRSYCNACQANAAGVSVTDGSVVCAETPCGGTAGSSCGDDEYCEYTPHCCDLDASGICTPRPDPASCSMTPDAPVSGCDGRSYVNACLAHAAGVDTRPPGTVCPATP